MLVLTRKLDESVVIDDRIVVTILGIEGDKVKIGITAPRDVTILRQELYQAVLEQNALASRLATSPEPSTFQELRDLLANEAAQSEENEPKTDQATHSNPEDPTQE